MNGSLRPVCISDELPNWSADTVTRGRVASRVNTIARPISELNDCVGGIEAGSNLTDAVRCDNSSKLKLGKACQDLGPRCLHTASSDTSLM